MSDVVDPARLDQSEGATIGEAPTRARWWRILRRALRLAVVGAVVSGAWWGPRVLARFDFFHVRRVEFEGLRYTRPGELMARLRLDTLQSVWQPMAPLEERVARHPMVASAVAHRRLPGTILLRVVEREPAALAPFDGRLQPADAAGHPLPIDPATMPLDVPLAVQPDSALLSVLDALRQSAPALYARITQAERAGPAELRFQLDSVLVRTGPDVTVARFKDILPVEADLARNALRAVELDLRFRDQVIARQP